jgi:hypothetical protein
MPCYEIRTVEVEFKVGNIDLLKKAIAKEGHSIIFEEDGLIGIDAKTGENFWINLNNSTIKADAVWESGLASFSNSIKRSYSAVVIDEVAKRNKWMKKDLGQNRFQLQRF